MSRPLSFLRVRRPKLSALLVLLGVLLIPVQLAAQGNQDHKHHHYRLFDLGTFGGPLSIINVEPTGGFTNNSGAVVGWADTAVSTPVVPDCFNPILNPDCFIVHAFVWRGDGLQDLGTLPGGNFSAAEATNQRGQIVGVSENGQIDPDLGSPVYHAVLWENGKLRDLGTLGGTSSFAISLNDQGQITGPALNNIPDPYSIMGGSTQTHAFLWERGKMQDLGTLGGPDSFPVFVNNRGQVAGVSYTSNDPDPNTGVPPLDPFLWTKGKGMQDLGNFGGTNPFGFPAAFVSGLNNRGQVAGTMTLPGDQTYHAFLWDGKELADLGTFGGSISAAYGLNDAGVVVGFATPAGDQAAHAFRWANGVMTDLGTVDDDLCSVAENVNSKGQVVGASQDARCEPFTRAFLWENGGPSVDLNALIPPTSALKLTSATFITERGEIVGVGKPPGCADDDDSCGHVYVLIPCDENHLAAKGCDYGLVDTSAMAQKRRVQVAETSAPATAAKSSPAERLTRIHSAMSSSNRWVRSLLRTLAQR